MGAPRRTLESFIRDSNAIHNNKFDYSLVEWRNTHTHVLVTCPIHGPFSVTPHNHLAGWGCPICKIENSKKLVYGVGIADVNYARGTTFHSVWKGMLERCYSPRLHEKEPTYFGCSVCPEWLYLSNFKEWFDENYIKGYQLDKDILTKGNKIYSPDTCCFVPREMNSLLIRNQSRRGSYPIGVHRKGSVYIAQINRCNERICIGRFDTPESAFHAYKKAKEQYVKELAEKYYKEGKITERVYRALLAYEVEITD